MFLEPLVFSKDVIGILHKGLDVGLCLRLEAVEVELTWHLP
jgi:hypothetical protein